MASNIFGSSGLPNDIVWGGYQYANTSTPTAAEIMIDYLRKTADDSVKKTSNSQGWLNVAASAGQNSNANGFVTKQHVAPDRVSLSTLQNRWTVPTMPTLPTLPDLPNGLKVDFATIKGNVQADLDALQRSWVSKFLPAETDVSSLDRLFEDILDGSNERSVTAKLDALAAEVKSTLQNINSLSQNTLATSIMGAKAALGTTFSRANTSIGDGLAIAGDNTQNIAWVRARDQVNIEALRNEREAVSVWAARGFALPGGALTSKIQRAKQATIDSTIAIAAEQAVKTQQLFFDVTKVAVEAYLREMDAYNQITMSEFSQTAQFNLRAAEMQLDANKFDAELSFKNLGLRLDFTKFSADMATRYRLGVIQGVNGLVSAYASLVGNETQYVATIASAHQAAYAAMVEYFRAALQYAEINVKTELENNAQNLQFTNTAANFIGQAVGHHVQAAMASADVYARIAAASLGGLNGVASTALVTNA